MRDRKRVWRMRAEQRPSPPPESTLLPEFAYRGKQGTTRGTRVVTAAVEEVKGNPVVAVAMWNADVRPRVTHRLPILPEGTKETRASNRVEDTFAGLVNKMQQELQRQMQQQFRDLSDKLERHIRRNTNVNASRERDDRAPPSAELSSALRAAVKSEGLDSRRKNPPPPTQNVNLACWNCGGRGHRFSECTIERTRFCYRCGKRGVVSAECPACTGNGKGGRR